MKKEIRFLTKNANKNYRIRSGIKIWEKQIKFLSKYANQNYIVLSGIDIRKRNVIIYKYSMVVTALQWSTT